MDALDLIIIALEAMEADDSLTMEERGKRFGAALEVALEMEDDPEGEVASFLQRIGELVKLRTN
jgi:hypothetical protein